MFICWFTIFIWFPLLHSLPYFLCSFSLITGFISAYITGQMAVFGFMLVQFSGFDTGSERGWFHIVYMHMRLKHLHLHPSISIKRFKFIKSDQRIKRFCRFFHLCVYHRILSQFPNLSIEKMILKGQIVSGPTAVWFQTIKDMRDIQVLRQEVL